MTQRRRKGESEPARESKHAVVIGQPSMFNRESLCKPAMHTE